MTRCNVKKRVPSIIQRNKDRFMLNIGEFSAKYMTSGIEKSETRGFMLAKMPI